MLTKRKCYYFCGKCFSVDDRKFYPQKQSCKTAKTNLYTKLSTISTSKKTYEDLKNQ